MGEQATSQFQPEERAFLEAIADNLSGEAGQRLRSDIEIARVERDSDFLTVDLPGYERPEYRGHHNLPFEGKMRAADGGAMTVLVNMDPNDRFACSRVHSLGKREQCGP